MSSEAGVEDLFVRRCHEYDIWAPKAEHFIGLDRMMICPKGFTLFVELKAPDGELDPRQTLIRDDLVNRGHHVYTLDTKKAVELFFLDIVEPLLAT